MEIRRKLSTPEAVLQQHEALNSKPES